MEDKLRRIQARMLDVTEADVQEALNMSVVLDSGNGATPEGNPCAKTRPFRIAFASGILAAMFWWAIWLRAWRWLLR